MGFDVHDDPHRIDVGRAIPRPSMSNGLRLHGIDRRDGRR
jgi:hypothetical protein